MTILPIFGPIPARNEGPQVGHKIKIVEKGRQESYLVRRVGEYCLNIDLGRSKWATFQKMPVFGPIRPTNDPRDPP